MPTDDQPTCRLEPGERSGPTQPLPADWGPLNNEEKHIHLALNNPSCKNGNRINGVVGISEKRLPVTVSPTKN